MIQLELRNLALTGALALLSSQAWATEAWLTCTPMNPGSRGFDPHGFTAVLQINGPLADMKVGDSVKVQGTLHHAQLVSPQAGPNPSRHDGDITGLKVGGTFELGPVPLQTVTLNLQGAAGSMLKSAALNVGGESSTLTTTAGKVYKADCDILRFED